MPTDLTVTFPRRGLIRLESRSLFGDAGHPACGRFLERVSGVPEVVGVAIRGGRAPHAEIRFRVGANRLEPVVHRIIAALRRDGEPAEDVGEPARWEIRLVRPGRLRMRNRAIRRRSAMQRAVARELSGTLGVEDYRIDPVRGAVRIDFDPTQVDGRDVVALVDAAVRAVGNPGPADPGDWQLTLCTASLPIAAAGQLAVPTLLPMAAALYALAAWPTLRAAQRAVCRERRLGTEFLDSAVVLGCLGTMSILPGAVFLWCVGIGRAMAGRTHDDARRLLLDGFGKQPRSATLDRDGVLVRVPVDRLRPGDRISVRAGEVVPADGRIVRGGAVLDTRPLNLESPMTVTGPGGRVLAATIAMAGRIEVEVDSAGEDTAAARIGRILDRAADSGPSATRPGEALAGRAVLPTAAMGALGLAAIGPAGALAVLGRDFRTGLRMAAPLSWIGALALCAHEGILFTDPDALERISRVDTVLFHHDDDPAFDRFGLFGALQSLGIEIIETRGAIDIAAQLRALRAGGRTPCYIGRPINAEAAEPAEVAISVRGLEALDDDAAHVLFLDGNPERLIDLVEIARGLDRGLRRGWVLVLLPNLAAVAAVFAAGLGVLGSVAVNNLAALAALINAAPGLRRAARLEAERRHRLEVRREIAARMALDVATVPAPEGLRQRIPATRDTLDASSWMSRATPATVGILGTLQKTLLPFGILRPY